MGHECAKSARDYSHKVNHWFESSSTLFDEKRDEFELKDRLELPNTAPREEAATLNDAIAVIRWYQDQIYVKLMRAIEGMLEEPREILKDFPKDSDGSAKVALLALDRSIAAWGILLNHFPDREDDLLEILVHLERLRRKTEKEFPEARAFVRPGFDDD